jgi:glycosyltransferase involved in cell wall biosynthesis
VQFGAAVDLETEALHDDGDAAARRLGAHAAQEAGLVMAGESKRAPARCDTRAPASSTARRRMAFLLLMPSYNQAHFIVEAVASVLAQDDPDWELWIVDNSSDDTPQVMQRYAGEPRIRFHHIPERMPPGRCLNWMLDETAGRGSAFSYVHTDNNLDPAYVRRMRAALGNEALALAYCDMRTIDDAGRRIAVTRRGAFDLARLLSLSPLGVPFSATVALAERLGGFSVDDVADDVRFCIEAWVHARFVHLPEPLIDYRLHGGSRTEASGGEARIHRAFLATVAHVRPVLERAGLKPLEVLAEAVQRRLDDLDLAVEHWAYVRGLAGPRWGGVPRLDPLYRAGLVPLPGRWRRRLAALRPPRAQALGALFAPGGLPLAAAWDQRRLRRELGRALPALEQVLLPWALLTLDLAPGGAAPALRLTATDARTLIGAAVLRDGLGCELRLDAAAAESAPRWLALPPARGGELALDLARAPLLVRVQVQPRNGS